MMLVILASQACEVVLVLTKRTPTSAFQPSPARSACTKAVVVFSVTR
jgi:hypothetical protein